MRCCSCRRERTELDLDNCVKALIDKYPTLTFCLDEFPGVHIVPVILTDDCTTVPENVGRMEYQVSDGPPGARSRSLDSYTLEEAIDSAGDLNLAQELGGAVLGG
jgi:hypothetical protein